MIGVVKEEVAVAEKLNIAAAVKWAVTAVVVLSEGADVEFAGPATALPVLRRRMPSGPRLLIRNATMLVKFRGIAMLGKHFSGMQT
jgi:hypothetical protein